MEEFEYDGIWWLPENPDNKISGTLKFHPEEGANLKLIGSFKTIEEHYKNLEPDVILGITKGKNATLYKCYESESNISVPGFLHSSFAASIVFIGHHFEKGEEIIFDSLSINYSHLEEWTKITGFQFSMNTDSDNHFKEYKLNYSFPKRYGVRIDNLKISLDYNLNIAGDRTKEFSLKQTTFIKIELDKQIHFNDYNNKIFYHIQNFLSLAMGRAINPLIIKGRNKACKSSLQDGRVVYNDISIFYSIKYLSVESKHLDPFDILFSFRDIKDNFEKCLKNWFAKAEILKPVYDLYFGIIYNPRMYLEHEFLSLVQAIESYHRRICDGKYLSDDDYAPIHETLIKAIPQELKKNFRESLKQRLKYNNEFSLRKRLQEILGKCGNVVNSLIHNNAIFIDDIVNTRNFLTHYDKSIEEKAKRGQDLYKMVQRMKFLLETCFLIELEMPIETIKHLISRNKRYNYLSSELKD